MRAFDLSKFGKALQKSNSNISIGFNDPTVWVSSGNYALNYLVSGDFQKGFPIDGKMTVLAGESGSGKSYISSGSVIKWCQEHGVQVILLDTEHAIDKSWVSKLGVDSEKGVMKIDVGLIDDITSIVMGLLNDYKAEYKDTPYEEKPPLLVVIDSLGMATTGTEVKQAEEGDNKGDMGRKQKQLYSMCRTFMASVGNNPIGMLATQHTYKSQDLYLKDDIVSGGRSIEFTPSILVVMTKKKLKDEDSETSSGVKQEAKNVVGVRVNAIVRKTRYNKPFQPCSFEIPYDKGLNPYSGLFDLLSTQLKYKDRYILNQTGAWVCYYDLKTGEEIFKKYRKQITSADYDRIMADYMAVKDEYTPPAEEDEAAEADVDGE